MSWKLQKIETARAVYLKLKKKEKNDKWVDLDP